MITLNSFAIGIYLLEHSTLPSSSPSYASNGAALSGRRWRVDLAGTRAEKRSLSFSIN
jgi:hypothetical protein